MYNLYGISIICKTEQVHVYNFRGISILYLYLVLAEKLFCVDEIIDIFEGVGYSVMWRTTSNTKIIPYNHVNIVKTKSKNIVFTYNYH